MSTRPDRTAPNDPSPHDPSLHDAGLTALSIRDADQAEDRRRLRITLLLAAAFHLVLFFVHLPALAPAFEVEAAEPIYVYPVRPLPRIKVEKPPPVAPEPRPELPTIPVPEHLMPEIVREPELAPVVRLDLPPIPTDFEIPGPPPRVIAPEIPPTFGPIEVKGEVKRPITLFSTQPQYTESARRIRLEGDVILEAVIDKTGQVTDLKVLKGLPLGLTESAVQAARQWRFEPATLRDRPVAVYWRLKVSFLLQ